ncbi:MAG: NAD(P)H-dependent oxidoreductase [Planctomycetes bacterium]|nr:NAD(P)H-dependent oxidoreductase [Planctomycetota bacterium]
MRTLIIVGHPRLGSLCTALADAYERGAVAAGAHVRRMDLATLVYDLSMHEREFALQVVEPDIRIAREQVTWCQHVVFVYPVWWGSMPALLKGFLDRMLAPGFAFTEREGGQGFTGLLRGRSAQLLMTMDTPPWAYRWILRGPGAVALRRDTLGFCGIGPIGVERFGPVIHSSPAQRAAWLARAESLGRGLPRTIETNVARLLRALGAWVAALRLQFYPMTWLAYTLGALIAARGEGRGLLDLRAYLMGYAAIFLLEVGTVLFNELEDQDSDRSNGNHGPFTGGSRVLVEGRLRAASLRRVAGIGAATGAAAMTMAAGHAAGWRWDATIWYAAGAVLCLGYTVRPLRMCYRGLGELDVAITHGWFVLILGAMLQGGAWSAPVPWLLGLPVVLAIFPAIVIAGIPDLTADRLAGKRTLAVRLGTRGAATLALISIVASGIAAAVLGDLASTARVYHGLWAMSAPHLVLIAGMLIRYLRAAAPIGRLDGLLAASLSYIMWFVLVPVVRLW